MTKDTPLEVAQGKEGGSQGPHAVGVLCGETGRERVSSWSELFMYEFIEVRSAKVFFFKVNTPRAVGLHP